MKLVEPMRGLSHPVTAALLFARWVDPASFSSRGLGEGFYTLTTDNIGAIRFGAIKR